MKTFWITFYSYKGGVGRSLALANIAALLAQRGRNVVLIDFDLEAPGLDSFQEFKSIAGKPGVVEYVTEFEKIKKAPDISQFVHSCELSGNLRGKVWVMPAGKKDKSYNSLRTKLDWIQLYNSNFGELFIENWKAAITRYCLPDYVLVDSRTGLTDIGGICTLHLPDLVVILFGLNEQNVRGVGAVSKAIRESEFKHVPQLHYVASPVPNLPKDKDSAFVKRWIAATNDLGVKVESSIRYQPIAALSEKLFVLNDPNEAPLLVEDYRNLLNKLIDYNRNGIDYLQIQAREAIRTVDTDRINRLLKIFQEDFPKRTESLMIQAELQLALNEFDVAMALAYEAIKTDPVYDTPFKWLIEQLGRSKRFQEILELCNYVLQFAERIPADRIMNLHSIRGQSAMTVQDFERAVESYNYWFEHELKANKIPEVLLVPGFNLVEAVRRKEQKPCASTWKEIISYFEKAGQTSASPLPVQANYWQAMHIPFALTGDVDRAREALKKARHAAELVSPVEDIFSVKYYTYVPAKEWLEINDEMLGALDRGQLWDGMLIAPESPDGNTASPKV